MTENKDFEKYMAETEENRRIISRIRSQRLLNVWFVRAFLAVFFGFFVLSLIIPLRPTYSETEKRELARFPKFTFQAFFSGDYFDGINEWYSDTFPLRDELMGINTLVTSAYGKTDVKIHGTVEKGDEIPDAPSSKPEKEESSSAESTSSETVSSEESKPSATETPSSAPSSVPPPVTPPAPTTQTLGALLINGDTAYEYYNFVQKYADGYTAAINKASTLLNGKATVYDMLVPTSMGICVPDELLVGVNTSDQKKAINYMYAGMKGVKTVPIYDTLKSHNSEYIYFRTDHHWTALGAYYAYTQFAAAKGVPAVPLNSFGVREFSGFLGTFYSSSGKLPQLAARPDTVYAYVPPMTNSVSIIYEDKIWRNTEIISDMSHVSAGSKYMTFIKGDRPLSVIKNPTLNDGSTCIVIKESFGNAFVPFLVPHYQNLYVVDYRHIAKADERGLLQLQAATGAKDILFINNVSATRNKALVNSINYYIR